MGKKNLAIVGTETDYFADMFDENTGLNPSIVTSCASPEDAATSYFRDIFENSNAIIRYAAVAVWAVAAGPERQLVFDITATVTYCEEADAEPGECDVFINAVLRS